MLSRISIRAKLFTLFLFIFIASVIFLSYMASRIMTDFGEYSATENESNIRSQASFFLSQVTHEKALRCENIFERIAVSSVYLAQQAAAHLNLEHIVGTIPLNKPDLLFKPPGSKLYSNSPDDPVMVLYWGDNPPDKQITTHLNTLSHMDPTLKTVIDKNSEAVACFITFEKATTRYYPNFPSIIRNLSEEAYEIRESAWYVAVKPRNNPEHRTVWSEVYQDPAGRGLMTTAVSPIYNPANEFIGAAGVDVTLVNITEKILTARQSNGTLNPKGMFSFIIDASGRIVAFPKEYISLFGFKEILKKKHTDYNALFNLKLSDSKIENIRRLWSDRKSENQVNMETVQFQDKKLLISSFVMPSTGWRLSVAVPESDLMESITHTRDAMNAMVDTMAFKFGAFALLIMFISLVGFTLLSYKYFIQPIDTLTHAAVKVKEGDLSQQVTIKREDEIGILARTFNTMVMELKKLRIKERAHAEHLQEKVGERTLELEEKTHQQKKTLNQLQLEIGERKEIEKKLMRSEEKYRDIFNNSVQSIFQSSLENRLLNANPSMARILGYDSIDDFLSTIKNLEKQVYVEPDQRKKFIGLLKKNDFVSGFETQLRKKDGTKVWVSICGRAINDDSGNFSYIQGSFEDISERKHAQQMFKKAKQIAEEASRAKSEFLTIMSHEIRTPLNAIIGMTRLTLTTELNKTQKEYLDAVLISSDHLMSLLNNILDFSKIEAGKFVLEERAFDIEALLNDMMTMFSFQAQKKNLTLTYSTGQIPRYVIGDIHRLRQILVNLVGNAIKFTKSGAISIHVTSTGGLQKDDNSTFSELLFSIKDTGVGIPSDKLSNIFNDFTQIHDANTVETGGTGLGLTITRQLIHLMEGDIWVESRNGEGSTFHFKIKLAQASEEQAKEVWNQSLSTFSESKGKQVYNHSKILIAEDFEVNRKLLVPFLEQFGHSVTTVENGKEVLEILLDREFDIILMDINMPIMDGIEATKKIRNNINPNISKIPIVALTAHAIKGDRERFLSVGMDEYISKPIQGEELLNCIENFSKKKSNLIHDEVKQPLFDLDYALKLMGGNQDIVNEICKSIIIKFPEELEKIKKASIHKDFVTISKTAHKLKSGTKSINSNALIKQLKLLCLESNNKNLDGVKRIINKLDNLIDDIVNSLKLKLHQ